MIVLHGAMFVAALPDMTSCLVFLVIVTGVSRKQPLHPTGNVAIGSRPNDEVYVVWHETHGKKWQDYVFLSFANELNERRIVRGIVKDFRLSVCSIEHVVTLTGEYLARRAGHAMNLSALGSIHGTRI